MTARLSRRLAPGATVCALGLAGPLLASAHPAHAAPATKTVKLQNFSVSPSKLQIKVGTRVTWRFLDGHENKHTVTSKNGRHGKRFRSSTGQDSGTYSVTFTKRGVYYYECSIHPLTMQGKIIVN